MIKFKISSNNLQKIPFILKIVIYCQKLITMLHKIITKAKKISNIKNYKNKAKQEIKLVFIKKIKSLAKLKIIISFKYQINLKILVFMKLGKSQVSQNI